MFKQKSWSFAGLEEKVDSGEITSDEARFIEQERLDHAREDDHDWIEEERKRLKMM
jgi:polyhydroxyalkanoate synthesis regulator phasin